MTNLDLIKNYSQQLWNNKNIGAIDNFFSPNATINSAYNDDTSESVCSIDKMKAVTTHWLDAFPDLTVDFEDYICEGNKVVSRWKAKGTHEGEFLDHAASNNIVEYNGVAIYEIEHQKIINYWGIVDIDKIFKQL